MALVIEGRRVEKGEEGSEIRLTECTSGDRVTSLSYTGATQVNVSCVSSVKTPTKPEITRVITG